MVASSYGIKECRFSGYILSPAGHTIRHGCSCINDWNPRISQKYPTQSFVKQYGRFHWLGGPSAEAWLGGLEPPLSECEEVLCVTTAEEPTLWRKGRCRWSISIFHSRGSLNLHPDLPPRHACTEAQSEAHFGLIFWPMFLCKIQPMPPIKGFLFVMNFNDSGL